MTSLCLRFKPGAAKEKSTRPSFRFSPEKAEALKLLIAAIMRDYPQTNSVEMAKGLNISQATAHRYMRPFLPVRVRAPKVIKEALPFVKPATKADLLEALACYDSGLDLVAVCEQHALAADELVTALKARALVVTEAAAWWQRQDDATVEQAAEFHAVPVDLVRAELRKAGHALNRGHAMTSRASGQGGSTDTAQF